MNRKKIRNIVFSMATVLFVTSLATVSAEENTIKGKNTPRILKKILFPSDDVVIITADVVEDYGADPTGEKDCTDIFQKAIDDATKNGGGIVWAPAGRYRFDGRLILKTTVTLRGEWRNPDDFPNADGTILCPRNKGEDPFITLTKNSVLKGISVWYPDQKWERPIAYAWTIDCWEGVSFIENVTLYNSYDGVRCRAENPALGIYGTVLHVGLSYEHSGNFAMISGLNIAPKYWIGSKLNPALSESSEQDNLRTFTRDQCIAVKYFGVSRVRGGGIGRLDNVALHKIRVEDAKVGLFLRSHWSDIVDFNFTNVRCGIDAIPVRSTDKVHVKSAGFGFGIIAGRIHVLAGEGNVGIRYGEFGGEDTTIQGVTIGGEPDHCIEYNDPEGVLNVMKSEFNSWKKAAITAKGGAALLLANKFSKTTAEAPHINFGSAVKSISLLGSTWDGPKFIRWPSGAKVTEDDTPLAIPDLPSVASRYQYIKHRKPANPDVFISIEDFGAQKGGAKDCTDAIQKALNQAQEKGGGTVFIPAGIFRVNGHLTVPAGVSLRGIGHCQHANVSPTLGSLLHAYEGKGSTEGPAFITLEEGSSIQGFRVHYPENTLDREVRFPWTVRGHGANIYIRDLLINNPYNGVDLGTHRCDSFRISGMGSDARNIMLYVGGGSANGVIEATTSVWEYKTGHPAADGVYDRGELSNNNFYAGNTPFVFGECSNITGVRMTVFHPIEGSNNAAFLFANEGQGIQESRFLLSHTDAGRTFIAQGGGKIDFVNQESTHMNDRMEASFKGQINFFLTTPSMGGTDYPEVYGGALNIYQSTKGKSLTLGGESEFQGYGMLFRNGTASGDVFVGPQVRSASFIGCVSTLNLQVRGKMSNPLMTKGHISLITGFEISDIKDPAYQWEFDESLQGFTGILGVKDLQWEKDMGSDTDNSKTAGCVSGNYTNVTPSIISPKNLGIDLSDKKAVRIRLKNSSSTAIARFLFSTRQDANFSADKMIEFNLVPDDPNFTEYTILPSMLSTWTGTLDQIRLTFIPPVRSKEEGSFSIDYIRLY